MGGLYLLTDTKGFLPIQSARTIQLMNSREIIKKLKDDGWVLHHVRGDHHQFKHPIKSGKVTVPHPNKDMAIGTLKSIYKQAGWDWK